MPSVWPWHYALLNLLCFGPGIMPC